jgi:hypothetical protein
MPEPRCDDPIGPPDAIEPGVELMDAAREQQPAEQPDVQALVRIIEKLTATNERNERLLAERAASPVKWLTIKVAAHRALLGDEQMRRWEKRGWVNSKREGRMISIDQDSLDARLRRIGREPYLGK